MYNWFKHIIQTIFIFSISIGGTCNKLNVALLRPNFVDLLLNGLNLVLHV